MTELDTYIKFVNIFHNKYNRFPTKFYAKFGILCSIIDQAMAQYTAIELRTMGFNDVEFITDDSKMNAGELQ